MTNADNVYETFLELQRAVNDNAERIRDSRTRNQAWKDREMARFTVEARRIGKVAREQAAAATALRRRELERTVFGIDHLPGDPASKVGQLREARRVVRAEVKEPIDAKRMLNTGERGDPYLTAATLELCYELRMIEPVNYWLDDLGHAGEHNQPCQDLWHMTDNSKAEAQRVKEEMALYIHAPAELMGLSESQIERLADTDLEQAEAAAKAAAERTELAHQLARGVGVGVPATALNQAAAPAGGGTMPLNSPGIAGSAAAAVGGQVVTNLD